MKNSVLFDFYKSNYWKFNDKVGLNLSAIKNDKNNFLCKNFEKLRDVFHFKNLDLLDNFIIVFRILELNKNNNYDCIFATLIAEYFNPKKKYLPDFFIDKKNNLVYKYCTVGYSFSSSDGEFRKNLFNIKHIINFLDNHKSSLSKFTQFFETLKKKNLWRLYYEFTCSTNFDFPSLYNKNVKINLHIDKSIIKHNLINILMFLNYIKLYQEIKTQNISFNVSEFYKNIFIKGENFSQINELNQNELSFFDSITKHDKNILTIFDNAITSSNFLYGIKLVPLYLNEVIYPFTLTLNIWKEIYILDKLTEFSLNNIYDHFPISPMFFYSSNINKNIFDSQNINYKIKKSEYSKNIFNLLIRSKFISSQVSDIDLSLKYSQTIIEKFKHRFNFLIHKLNLPISFLTNKLIISNINFSFISSYNGDILYKIPIKCKIDDKYHKNINHLYHKSGFDFFNKHLFELFYSLFILNKKLNVIHGDLHLANITFNKNYNLSSSSSYILYNIDNKFRYAFRENGWNITIIDYSRSILFLDNYKKNKYYNTYGSFSTSISPKYSNTTKHSNSTETSNIFYNSPFYINTMVTMILNHFNQFKVHQKKIICFASSNKNIFFKFSTLIDSYNFIIKYIYIFSHKKNIIKIHKYNLDLLHDIKNYIESFYEKRLNIIIKDSINTNEKIKLLDLNEFPHMQLIKHFFCKYRVTSTNKKKYDNKILFVNNFQNKTMIYPNPNSKKNPSFVNKLVKKYIPSSFSSDMRKKKYIIENIIPKNHVDKFF